MMVEITYQMVLSTIQTISLVIGISYYIMVLRNQQKNQKHAQGMRKIQLLNDIREFTSNSNNDWNQMMEMEWTDFEDFETKYSWESNPEVYNARVRMWRNLNYYGLLVEDDLIDAGTYARTISDQSPIVWDKFKDIIIEMRRRTDNPEQYIGMEILAKETDKYRESKGLKPRGNP
jgi:hypothetical protein